MGDFQVHHVQFFEYVPQAIRCMAYCDALKKLAIARSVQSDNVTDLSLACVEIWNTRDVWCLDRVFHAVVPIESMLWCKNRLFTGGMDEQLHEHDVNTGKIRSSASSHNGVIWCMASNTAQSCIAAGTEGGCIVLFDVTDEGNEYNKVFSNQGDRILSIAWHDRMSFIVTGGIDNIRVWNVHTGQAVRRLCVERASNNLETFVTNVAVIKDFTIVSGDSRGYTSFWDGHTGTQIKSLHPHLGPVFAMCVTGDGLSVLTSGADPSLYQFEYVSGVDGDKWIRTSSKVQHSHDVRSLVYTGSHVVSGGVDGKLVINTVVDGKSLSASHIIPSLPQRTSVHSASAVNSILLQYPTRLELWSLGSTSEKSVEDSAILDLDTAPCCRVSLAARDGCFVHCSAVSSDASWIAYSDQLSFRLFHNSSTGSSSSVITRVRCLSDVKCVSCIAFSPDSSHVLVASDGGQIHVVTLHITDPTVAKVLNVSRDCKKTVSCSSLSMSSCGRYLAVGDLVHGIHVYRVKKHKYLCTVPVSRPTSIAFHHTQPLLLVSTADRQLVEYNIERREYTAWSRDFQSKAPTQWKQRKLVLRRAFYNSSGNQIMVYDDEAFAVIDKNQPFPKVSVKLFQSGHLKHKVKKHEAFHICERFKYLVYIDSLADDSLVIVERSSSAMLESLPPSLRRKKFSVGCLNPQPKLVPICRLQEDGRLGEFAILRRSQIKLNTLYDRLTMGEDEQVLASYQLRHRRNHVT